MVLLAGKTITANPFSVVGDIGKSRKVHLIKNLLEKLEIKFKHYPTSTLILLKDEKTSSGYSSFTDLKDQDKEFIQKLLQKQKDELVQLITKRRGMQIKKAVAWV